MDGRGAGRGRDRRSSARTGWRCGPRLDDAIDTALGLAEADAGEPLSGVGVVVTGSVVTAGEARALFGKDPA